MIRFPPGLLAVAIALFAFAGFGPNIALAAMSVAVLLIGSAILWRPHESPILIFVFLYQWMQSSIAIFHSNKLGISVQEYSVIGGNSSSAIIMSLFAILAVSVGMRCAAGPVRESDGEAVRASVLQQPLERWFRLYIIAVVIGVVALVFSRMLPALSQPLQAVANMKWAFFFALAYGAFVSGRALGYMFLGAFLAELALGLGGYFSDFKTVIFVSLMAAVASGVRMTPGRVAALGALGALLVALSIIWTGVKGEFRSFVAGGEVSQSLSVGYAARLSKLSELVGRLDATTLAGATDQTFRRLSYVEIFGVVTENVPDQIPYEHGAIWWDAVSRPFMPRFLFPSKAAIDDSYRTNYYTGGKTGTYKATSISIGYIGESYVDFGPFGMIAMTFILGGFYGLAYRYFMMWHISRGIVGASLITAALLAGAPLESSITKVLGSIVVSLVVAWLAARIAIPKTYLWRRGVAA